MKVVPTSTKARWMVSRSASILTPRAASTSAAPLLEEAARLPCLATGTLQAAQTKATAVEMFKVPAWSPPVPHTSIASGRAEMRSIFSRITLTAPVISSMVSPRTRIAISKPPICAGVASPDIMMPNAISDWARVSGRPCAVFYRLWNVPGADTPEEALLDLAAQVLGGGKTSRLYQRLVVKEQLA